MKRLALIVPPLFTTIEGIQVPLGLLSIATYVRKYSDHVVEIFDFAREIMNGELEVDSTLYDNIAERVLKFKPDIIGISVINMSLPCALNLAKSVKRISPWTYIFLGGPGVDGICNTIREKFKQIDGIIQGEGEKSVLQMIDKYDVHEGDHSSKACYLAYKEYTRKFPVPHKKQFLDLSLIPLPDYGILEQHLEDYFRISGRKSLSIELARGCSCTCKFCGCSAFWGGRRRCFSIDRAIDEIETLQERYDIHHVYITDDNFLTDKKFAVELIEKLKEREIKISWDTRGRINSLEHEILEKLKEAGCTEILIGVESTSDTILESFGKGIRSTEQYERIKRVIEHGITPILSFILGYPCETRKSLNKTLLFLCKVYTQSKRVASHFHLLTLIPGTKLHGEMQDDLEVEDPVYIYGCCEYGNEPIIQQDLDLIKKYPRIFSSFYHVRSKYIDFALLVFISRFFNVIARAFSCSICFADSRGFSVMAMLGDLKKCAENAPGRQWFSIEMNQRDDYAINLFEEMIMRIDRYEELRDLVRYEKALYFLSKKNSGRLEIEITVDVFQYISSCKKEDFSAPLVRYDEKKDIVLLREGERIKVYGKRKVCRKGNGED